MEIEQHKYTQVTVPSRRPERIKLHPVVDKAAGDAKTRAWGHLGKISAIDTEIEATESTWDSEEFVTDRVVQDLSERRERGRAYPEVILAGGIGTRWPMTPVLAEPASAGYLPVAPDPIDLIVSLHFDELLARAVKQVRELYQGYFGPTLSPDAKRKRLKELRHERLEVERLECAAIWEAAEQGIFIPFRPDTDPRAVLGIDGPTPRND